MKFYDDKILRYLPHPHIEPWEKEGITSDIMKIHNICYDPKNQGIVIPHYDINNNLIGIRERTLIKDNETTGKYKPAIINGKMYNHPLGFNLYNLNNSKNAIKIIKKAIVFEGEKSCLLYQSYFGLENDISVACCGSSVSAYQIQLLMEAGAEEIVIAFDRQFQEIGDEEFKHLKTNLMRLRDKYKNFVLISFIFDKNMITGYKDSPVDCGPQIFLQLFKERIIL